jgi:enoyl-CoA hydratase/carnithine racemase
MRIASDTARVGITAARLGICIGYREMRRLVQTAGRSVAMDILLTGRLVDAREALHLGLVSQVADSAQVDEHTYDTAARIARLAPLSHKAHKEVMRTVLENPGLKALTAVQEALPFAHFDSKDFLEGRAAFLEKRRAEFRGE